MRKIHSIKELDLATKNRLKQQYKGFLHQLAGEINRHHAQVYRVFNDNPYHRSAIVELAVVGRVNQIFEYEHKLDERERKAAARRSRRINGTK